MLLPGQHYLTVLTIDDLCYVFNIILFFNF